MRFKEIPALLISLILLLMSASAQAGTDPSIAGVYSTVPGEAFNYDGESVDVVEFLSFSCGHCYSFERSIPVIKGNFPKKIKWRIVPIYWGERASTKPGEAYLLAEEAGKGEEMKKALFQASMVDKLNIENISVLEKIASETGLGFDFSKKLRAGEKAGEVRKGLQLAREYRVNETPTLIIAGNIMTSPQAMNHNLDMFRMNVIAIIRSILN